MSKNTPNTDPVQALLMRLEGVRQTGRNQWEARCPAHDDRHASLSVARGDDGRALLHCHVGCGLADILAAVGLAEADLFPPSANAGRARPPGSNASAGRTTYPTPEAAREAARRAVARASDLKLDDVAFVHWWPYPGDGLRTIRFRTPGGKDYRPISRSGSGWVIGDPPGLLPLYGGDDLPAEGPIVLVEGEKVADAVREVGLAAVTSAHGCGSAHKSDWRPLAGRLVIALPDNDDGGRKYDQEAAAILARLSPPATVKSVELPGLGEHGDLCDWTGPDLGKSLLSLDLAARVSTGDGWPDCPAATGAPGGVVLLSAEDDLADTIRPRLDAAGADVARIMALEAVRVRDPEKGAERQSPFNLAADLPELEEAIRTTRDCRLVVIDPITAYLGRTDSHKNAEVRALLSPLSELAARCGVALVGVTHLRKGEGPAMYRAMGSLGFIAAARAAYGVAKDKDDPTGERRLFVRIKNNLTHVRTGLAYRLVAYDGGVPTVAWEAEPVDVAADDVLGPPPAGRPGPDPQERDEAVEWLRNALADGPRPAKELLAEAKGDGISEGTLKRAKGQLDVKAEKLGWQGGWVWRLPEAEP